MSRLGESLHVFTILEAKDKTGSAYVSDAFDAGRFNGLSVFLNVGAVTADSVLTVYCDASAALATSLTTAIAFRYRLSAAAFKAATADQYGNEIAVLATGLTMTAGTFNNHTIEIPVDPDTLGGTNHWMTINLSSVGNPMLVCAWVVGRTRQPGHLIPSAI